MIAIIKNIRDKNCSSAYCVSKNGSLRAGIRLSVVKLNVEAKKLKGKAPIPNETCKPSRPDAKKFYKEQN
ncbi:hypothetical protein BpHYR1_035687 [Brachionus plicatilis]|uniref:Uncharacterized protein n=1 Tax=Brachionus plicatilis TaxID=10195 RepID=A0A3M7QLE6_BRAPC|nr:hypothetical protein BpHYR1_035687 [Brachionus plicatilis]